MRSGVVTSTPPECGARAAKASSECKSRTNLVTEETLPGALALRCRVRCGPWCPPYGPGLFSSVFQKVQKSAREYQRCSHVTCGSSWLRRPERGAMSWRVRGNRCHISPLSYISSGADSPQLAPGGFSGMRSASTRHHRLLAQSRWKMSRSPAQLKHLGASVRGGGLRRTPTVQRDAARQDDPPQMLSCSITPSRISFSRCSACRHSCFSVLTISSLNSDT